MGVAAILFAIAAVLGVVMAVLRWQGTDRPPVSLALLHGAIAFAGLFYIFILSTGDVIAQPTPAPTVAFYAALGFIFAAVGGLTMFMGYHLRKKPLPIPIMLAHASLAIISFILLLVALGQA